MPTLTGAAGIGGILPDTYSKLILEPATQAATITQLTVSTTIQTASHETHVPVLHDDVSAQWLNEGDEIAPDDASFGEVVVRPAKCAALTLISSELANDSDPAAAELVGQSIARNLSVNMDTAAFGALAAPAPSGLGALAGVSTLNAGSAWTNLDSFQAAIATAQQYGATVTAFVTNPLTALAIAEIREASGSNKSLLTPDPTQPTRNLIAGVPLLVNAAVADGVVWAMPADRVVTVVRKSAEIAVSQDYAFSRDMVAVRGIMRVGFAFPSPKSIVRIGLSAQTSA